MGCSFSFFALAPLYRFRVNSDWSHVLYACSLVTNVRMFRYILLRSLSFTTELQKKRKRKYPSVQIQLQRVQRL